LYIGTPAWEFKLNGVEGSQDSPQRPQSPAPPGAQRNTKAVVRGGWRSNFLALADFGRGEAAAPFRSAGGTRLSGSKRQAMTVIAQKGDCKILFTDLFYLAPTIIKWALDILNSLSN
jgi:hypothetical protein